MADQLLQEVAEGVDLWAGEDFAPGETQEALQRLAWAFTMEPELQEKFNRMVDETRADYERERAGLE